MTLNAANRRVCDGAVMGTVLIFMAGALSELMAGTTAAFSLFSADLKASLQFSQPSMELAGELMNAGTYLGPALGLFAARYTFRRNAIWGASFCVFGYSMIFLIVRGIISVQSPLLVAVCFLVSGFGSGLLDMNALNANMQNFAPERRALYLGLLCGFFGFSGSLMGGLYDALYSGDNLDGILFMLVLLACVAGIAGGSFYPSTYPAQRRPAEVEQAGGLHQSLLNLPESQRHRSLGFRTIVADSSYWTFFVVFFIIIGPGVMHLNNVGNMLKSLNNGLLDHATVLSCVVVLSVAGGLGRIFSAVSDICPFHRAWFITFASACLMVGHMINAFVVKSPQHVFFTTGLIGFAYGIIWSTMPVLVGEFFGPAEFGEYWSWLNIAPGLSSILFNQLTGAFYQVQVLPAHLDCQGKKCFLYAFYCASGAAAVGCFASLILVYRTSPTRSASKSTGNSDYLT